MKIRDSFPFENEKFQNKDYIYFELLKQWKYFRYASFPKDFLNLATIMPDITGKETIVKHYCAGLNANIGGRKITLPSQFDTISIKYNTDWDHSAIAFYQANDEENPKAAICIVDDENNYTRKEDVEIFKEETEDGGEQVATTEKENS